MNKIPDRTPQEEDSEETSRYRAAFIAKVEEGLRDTEAGRVVSNDELWEEIEKALAGKPSK